MNATFKKYLIISVKQAVQALSANTFLWATMPKTFHFHDWSGVTHFLLAAAGVIVGREAAVWVPRVVAWAYSSDDKA